ncbi:dihydroneopterin aldolase family protein [Halovenus halobia]|uniref:dihydroneopterin aldolase family protein n=1 Tax=Halovenus halobia TaxID=3396622 RepID=UPI003F56ECFA
MSERTPAATENACFEAGIKFGSLYHQFAGTPISPDSAASLAAAMEEAIENQPHCETVRVDIDTDRLAEEIAAGTAEYTELTGEFMTVEMEINYEGVIVTTAMHLEEGYPLMEVTGVTEGA